MSRSNHARTKEKQKKYRLKALQRRIYRKRVERMQDAGLPVSSYGQALLQIYLGGEQYDTMRLASRSTPPGMPNQRQRRKVARQMGRYPKRK